MWLRPCWLSGNFDPGTGQILRSSQETPIQCVNALLMRCQSKCEPYRDESFAAPALCDFCCSEFLPGLPSRGGDASFDLSFVHEYFVYFL